MSRFVVVVLVAGFIAAAVGFGDFSGVPKQVILVARALAGLSLLLLVAYVIASIGPGPGVRKRAPRDHRPHSREAR